MKIPQLRLWTKLGMLYLTKTMPNKCYLLRQFYLEENIDKFTKLIQDLTNCDEKLAND